MCSRPIPKELADGTFNNHRSRDVMYAGRFILGIGVGIEGGGVGVYISESVPSNKRGSLVSLYQLSIALGEVLGYAIAAIFYEVHGGWRFMVGSSLVFSTIVLIGLFFLPESPRYLVFKGKFGEAFNVFARLRDLGTDTARSSLCRWSRLLRQKESCVSRRTRARCGLSWSPSPETAVPWCMVL